MHQKITHTSRFAYATASVITEYNVCKNKPRIFSTSVEGDHIGRYVSGNFIFQ